VLPRYRGDTFRLASGQSTVATARDELDEIAAKIRLKLATT
jgi:hypothetical protein